MAKNPDLLPHFITFLPGIANPLTRQTVLQHYSKVLQKSFPQDHAVLLEYLDTNPEETFSKETLTIISQLPSINPQLKQLLIEKAKSNVQLITYVAAHLNMQEVEEVIPTLVSQPETSLSTYMSSLLEAPEVDPSEVLAKILSLDLATPQVIKALKVALDLRHVYYQETLQAATEKIVRLEPIPETCMYFILKANELYPQLKSFFISYALPYLLERKVWEYPRIWKGFVTFIERTTPDSIQVLDLMPHDVQQKLLQRETIRKGKLEETMRKQKS